MASGRIETQELTVITFNIQVGIGSHRARHMLLHGWRYVMPHGQSLRNLEHIGALLHGADFVGLNEADAGSFRTRYVNQASFLAEVAGYPHWEQQRTRDLGELAQHSNSVLSRWPVMRVERYGLPGLVNGRGVLLTRYEVNGRPLTVLVTHLALGKAARSSQARFLGRIVKGQSGVILMGDFNCTPRSPEMRLLLRETGLTQAPHSPATFPSWAPHFAFDHILCSRDLEIVSLEAIPEPLSDHLALRARLRWREEGQGG